MPDLEDVAKTDQSLDAFARKMRRRTEQITEWRKAQRQVEPQAFAWTEIAEELERLLVGATVKKVCASAGVDDEAELDGRPRSIDLDLLLADGRSVSLWIEPGARVNEKDHLDDIWENKAGLKVTVVDDDVADVVPTFVVPGFDSFPWDEFED